MWKEYGADGVAICSRYELLKAALDDCDGRPHLGLVRYGSAHLTGWNVQRFISTKRMEYTVSWRLSVRRSRCAGATAPARHGSPMRECFLDSLSRAGF